MRHPRSTPAQIRPLSNCPIALIGYINWNLIILLNQKLKSIQWHYVWLTEKPSQQPSNWLRCSLRDYSSWIYSFPLLNDAFPFQFDSFVPWTMSHREHSVDLNINWNWSILLRSHEIQFSIYFSDVASSDEAKGRQKEVAAIHQRARSSKREKESHNQ